MSFNSSKKASSEAANQARNEIEDTTDDHDDFGGLQRDLSVVTRRRALWLAGGALGAVALAACGVSSKTSTPDSTLASTTSTSLTKNSASSADCTKIPSETAGPFPGDGSNGPDVLREAGVVRRDIRSSFGPYSGTANGVPLTMRFKLLNIADGCSPYAGAALYVWHCTADGGYSLYSSGVKNQNFLRGVGQADSDGWVEFTTVFPGCYSGRWPHVHFEVYPSLEKATNVKNKIATSQLALPKDVCEKVYASSGYAQSARNLNGTSLASDMIFRDGWTSQLGTVTGGASEGFISQLNVGV